MRGFVTIRNIAHGYHGWVQYQSSIQYVHLSNKPSGQQGTKTPHYFASPTRTHHIRTKLNPIFRSALPVRSTRNTFNLGPCPLFEDANHDLLARTSAVNGHDQICAAMYSWGAFAAKLSWDTRTFKDKANMPPPAPAPVPMLFPCHYQLRSVVPSSSLCERTSSALPLLLSVTRVIGQPQNHWCVHSLYGSMASHVMFQLSQSNCSSKVGQRGSTQPPRSSHP